MQNEAVMSIQLKNTRRRISI